VNRARVAVIGGSGLYSMPGLTIVDELFVSTPFGDPSGPLVIGELDSNPVIFLARHGEGHTILPSEINFRANIYALKLQGVETILSASAVGSMKEHIHPTDLVFPLQFIDRTRHRPDTFFGNGIAAHVAFADPICAGVSKEMADAARSVGANVHDGGTYLCMEGPQFSTRAESNLYRSWGVDVIGMTNLQEAKLAREAEICYATMALVTDYDCWHETEEAVSVETVIEYLNRNAATACAVIRQVLPRVLARERTCPCPTALHYAIITNPAKIGDEVKERLAAIVGKYLS
jgi:5'-methylthioadenosine phosphorylase